MALPIADVQNRDTLGVVRYTQNLHVCDSSLGSKFTYILSRFESFCHTSVVDASAATLLVVYRMTN